MRDQEYAVPTPIQAQAIPHVLEGRDVLGAAQTGTGKTAAFTLPLLQLLAAAKPAAHRPVRALVLAPTRELALQVEQAVRTYGQHLHLRSTTIYGGVGMQGQIDALRRGVDIVVATPGRLLDHLSQKTLSLASVERVVLDEADRMLDMGFIHDVRRILGVLPRARQTLLFSATFSKEIRQLADAFLRDPVAVQVAAPNATVTLVSQVFHPVAQESKRSLLAHLIRTRAWDQLLVFTRTKHGANRLAEQLSSDGIAADAIHGNKSQSQRVRALDRFKKAQVQVLVATDLAARGIDIAELPCVVNFDLPHVAEDYVHRIGRTARAGSSGEAVSLVSRDERPLLAAVEALIRQKIQERPVEGFVPIEQGRPERKAPSPRGAHGQTPARRTGAAPARAGVAARASTKRTPERGEDKRTSHRGQEQRNPPRGQELRKPQRGQETRKPQRGQETRSPQRDQDQGTLKGGHTSGTPQRGHTSSTPQHAHTSGAQQRGHENGSAEHSQAAAGPPISRRNVPSVPALCRVRAPVRPVHGADEIDASK